MRIIKPKVELITEKDPYKLIELAGRTAYRSEDKITDGSAKRFFDALNKSGHFSVFEHANYIFAIHNDEYFRRLKEENQFANFTDTPGRYRLMSTNLRTLLENEYNSHLRAVLLNDVAASQASVFSVSALKTPEEKLQHTYLTMQFTISRGVSHQLVRHRKFSFTMESQGYVDYKGKDIEFIEPAWFQRDGLGDARATWRHNTVSAENDYKELRAEGLRPEEARGVLPNDTKTEIVVTGNAATWEHFFDLRSRELTGKVRPDMKVIADMALEAYKGVMNDVL